MFAKEGEWEALTDRERLVMVAISCELHQINPLAVDGEELVNTAGLKWEDLRLVLADLELKKLVRVEARQPDNRYWISLVGEARVSQLMPWPKRRKLMAQNHAREIRQGISK
jgi:hypothetical protein